MERPDFQDHNSRRFSNGVFSGMQSGGGPVGNNQPHSAHNGMSGIPYRGNTYAYPNQPQRNYPENRSYGQRYAGYADNKQSDNTALIVVAIVSLFMLFIAFLVTLLCLMLVVFRVNAQAPYGYSSYGQADGGTFFQGNNPFSEPGQSTVPGQGGGNSQKTPEGNHTKEYYGEIKDAIRTDLDYSIEWENYEYEGNNDYVMIEIDYPVIKGNVPNKDIINEHIAKETEYFEEYIEEYSRYMTAGDIFGAYSEGYVTYMDTNVMSVVFCEQIYTDYWEDYTLYCINIDMQNGVVINNSDLMKIDGEFVADFRQKSSDQNGNIGVLEQMTDQEVMYYLTDAGSSVLFYTPLGMEVGINFDEGYLTVTYKDYEIYLQRY